MDVGELQRLLDELRQVRTDHQSVEAKRAGMGLPETTHETLSAFANTAGGVILFGVDESAGSFDVTGVQDAKRMQSDLQSLCAEMDPPLRPTLDLVTHPDGTVLVAQVPAVPRNERPCHRRPDGPENGSFIRVGDADQKLTRVEVGLLVANRAGHDHSRTAAPLGATLSPDRASEFCTALRELSARNTEVPDEQLLRQWGALDDADQPTYAGLLTMGEHPEQFTSAARVTYRRHPRATDPQETRYAGKHLEGTVGELLDDTLAAIAGDLTRVQVVRDGQVRDDFDVPAEALREIISNALIHRSFAPGQRDTSILVEVSDDAVVITSPGGLHVHADPENLGLAQMSGVRNVCLVRVGEQIRTPTGGRVVEHQASGIAAADRACHRAGTMPVMFVDGPTTFQAILVRGRLDEGEPSAIFRRYKVTPTAAQLRLVAVLVRLTELHLNVPGPLLRNAALSARLAARSLATCSIEDAAAELRRLEDAEVLLRTRTRQAPGWNLRPRVQAPADPADRVCDLLAAIEGAPEHQLSAKGIGLALGLASPTSRSRWIRRAVDAGLIASTVSNAFDPTGAYRLTDQGRGRLRASAPRRKDQ